MNRQTLQGNWIELKGKVKETWGKLTDDDLTKIAGQREQLEGKIRERYGKTIDEVKKEVDTFYTKCGCG